MKFCWTLVGSPMCIFLLSPFFLTHIREAAGMIRKWSRNWKTEASGFKDCFSSVSFHKCRAWAGRRHIKEQAWEIEGMLKTISVHEGVIITSTVWTDRLSGTFWGTCGTPLEINFQRLHRVRLSAYTPHLLSLAFRWKPPFPSQLSVITWREVSPRAIMALETSEGKSVKRLVLEKKTSSMT